MVQHADSYSVLHISGPWTSQSLTRGVLLQRGKYFENSWRFGAGRVSRNYKNSVKFLKKIRLIQGLQPNLEEVHMIRHPIIHIQTMTIEWVVENVFKLLRIAKFSFGRVSSI